jgi:O-antigen ligase
LPRVRLFSSRAASLSRLCFSAAVLTSPFAFYSHARLLARLPWSLFAVAFYAFLVEWTIEGRRLRFPEVELPLAAYWWTTLISYFFTASVVYRQTWYMLLIVGIIPLAPNIITTPRHLEILYQALFLLSGAGALVGIWQFVAQYRAWLDLVSSGLIMGSQHSEQLYHYMTSFRRGAIGFTVHWVHFGCQQMLLFLVLLAYLLFARRPRPVWRAVAVIIAISIGLNLTRTVWLGCAVGGAYLLARWRPRSLAVIPAALLVAYLAAPRLVRSRMESVSSPLAGTEASDRLQMWSVATRMIRRHPWVGVGLENVQGAYPVYLGAGEVPIRAYHAHVHSNPLQIAAERGIPALVAWLSLMLALLWQFWKMRSSLTQMRWVVDGGIAAWLGIMIQGVFDYNWGIPSVLILSLFVFACPLIARNVERTAIPEAERIGAS